MHRILIVDDDTDLLNNSANSIKSAFPYDHIETAENFNKIKEKINEILFDLIILDVRLDKINSDEEESSLKEESFEEVSTIDEIDGQDVYNELLKFGSMHIIFYTAYPKQKSIPKENDFIHIIKKGNRGEKQLIEKIKEIKENRLFQLKEEVNKCMILNLRKTWDIFINNCGEKINKISESDSKIIILNKFSEIIPKFKYHSQENWSSLNYYEFPINDVNELKMGDILYEKSTKQKLLLLNRTCSLILRPSGKPKVKNCVLAKIHDYNELYEELEKQHTSENPGQNFKSKKNLLLNFIEKPSPFRYFPIPKTFFQFLGVIDFEDLKIIPIEQLKSEEYSKEYALAYDFAVSIHQRFTQYYGSFGFEDYDKDELVKMIDTM